MTTTQEKIAIMQAFVDGKEIEFKTKNREVSWSISYDPKWDWIDFDYRIKPEPPPTPMNIPWEFIKPEYKWAAKDENGNICLYTERPRIDGNMWRGWFPTQLYNKAFIIDPGTVRWKDSLQERP